MKMNDACMQEILQCASIPSGKIMGGLEVQLTDAFFADPWERLTTLQILWYCEIEE